MRRIFRTLTARQLMSCLFLFLILTRAAPVYCAFERDPSYSGIWQDYGNGWQYCYHAAGDYAYWKDGDALRLGYNYTTGWWWDHGTSWNRIGTSGQPSTFIGDGNWHSLGNGWSYQYTASGDYAWWKDGDSARLGYNYQTGYWWDNGTSWNKIGGAGASSKFIGDGGWYDLNNGWKYQYTASGDYAWWKDGDSLRFGYNYVSAYWWHHGISWDRLSGPDTASKFIGDGTGFYNLKNGWTYCYSGGVGYWHNTALNVEQFKYDYATGQWFDQGNGDGWEPRGSKGLPAAFIGDGNSHTMDGKWSYALIGGVGYWTNTVNHAEYRYDYSSGNWERLNQNGRLWEDYQNTTMKAAYVDLTGTTVITLFPPQGIQQLDVIVLGFADLNSIDAKPKYLKDMQDIVRVTYLVGGKHPEIFFSIGGEHSKPQEIIAAGGPVKVAENVIAQVTKYNKGLTEAHLTGQIVGIDLDLENNVDANTINLLAKTIHEAGLKVSIAPQVFATANKQGTGDVNSNDPTNLILTSGTGTNTYGDAIKNGYVDQIMVQAYNEGSWFKVDGYPETEVESFKSISRALNVWVSGATYFPIPETTKIFVGSVANQLGGGANTFFNPDKKDKLPYEYNDQKILNQLKGDIATMQEDPVNYDRISGVFFWALANDYSPKRFGISYQQPDGQWRETTDIWSVAGGFSTTIFGATPVPEPPFTQNAQWPKQYWYTGDYLKYW